MLLNRILGDPGMCCCHQFGKLQPINREYAPFRPHKNRSGHNYLAYDTALDDRGNIVIGGESFITIVLFSLFSLRISGDGQTCRLWGAKKT